ncbi:unnamed protein product [Didymodactylos carnosus]|uniref:Peptidase C14 caspase domain-containing protein n=1 Tax=Didymodactylos carnosus TaxID=1234261 RepID=A0A8S2JFR2_9BILA|nr:unnamed protein product [Didymodactylos carnosus]CAF3805460.1 unnamed protein product [Didymodactylos carnosus]
MYGLIDQIGNIFTQRLLEYADSQEMFDAKHLNGQYTLDNIASCLFGLETNSLQNENATLINHLKKFFTLGLTNIFVLIFFISPRLASYLGKKGYTLMPMDAMDYLIVLINQVLKRRRQHLEKRNDFIQIMVDHEEEVKREVKTDQQSYDDGQQQPSGNLSKTLNDKEILGQALVFMIAGYETTSVLLSFFLYVMSTQPVIQEKVYEEIRQEFGDDEITYEKIGQLQYLDMVINETLRMYPPFIRFDRVASTSYELGGYQLPKGMIVSVPVYPLHHDPAAWPDPEKFIPESFFSKQMASFTAPGRKLALTIGINKYPGGSKLKYCINDARDIGEKLKSIEFHVSQGIDCNYDEFKHRLNAFVAEIKPRDLILFYFAGHGNQFEKKNYLLPSGYNYDHRTNERLYIEQKSINAQHILQKIEVKHPHIIIFILDCYRSSVKSRSINSQQDLTKIQGPSELLIAFSCGFKEGSTDATQNKRNGIFAEHLLKYITTPNQDIETIFEIVARDVKLKGFPLLWRTSCLTEKVYLVAENNKGKNVFFKTSLA